MSAAQLFLPASRAFNSNGLPVAGAVLKLYTTGTLVPQPMYSDSALTIPLGSSVTANAAGRFDTIYQDNATPFRLRIEDASGAELDDIDPFYFGQMDVSLDTIYPAAVGILADMPTLTIPTGIDIVSTTGADVIDHGGGTYVAASAPTARSGFTSVNSRNFVLSKEQVVTATQFYQATDADFQNAMQGSVDYLAAIARSGDGYVKGTTSLYIPPNKYLLHDQISPESAVNIFGESGTQGGSSMLQWTASTGHGFNLLGWDGASRHASGSTIRGLHLKGPFSSTRSAMHAIYVNGQVKIEDMFCEYWPGNAIYAFGDTSGPNGNVSLSTFRNIYSQFCDLTLKLQGQDSQAGTIDHIMAQSNRLGSYWDWSFLGNAARAIYSENCGIDPNFRTRCEKNGHIYVVAYGQETWCSTNSPSGTTASNTGWLYLQEGATNFYTDTWVTGQTWYWTAPISIGPPDNGNTLGRAESCYVEAGNPVVLGLNASCTLTSVFPVWQQDGTLHGSGPPRGAGQYAQFNRSIQVPSSVVAFGDTHNFGAQSGSHDLNFNLSTTNTITISFNRYDSGGSLVATDGSILDSFGAIYVNGVFGVHLRYNGADAAIAASTGLDLPTGKILSVNGTQVVGARGAAVAALTVTATSGSLPTADGSVTIANAATPTVVELLEYCRELEAKFEALTARFRAATGHGLIA